MSQAPPPRFVVRTTVATLAMVALLLSAVFIVVTLNVRHRVRDAVTAKLEAGQRMLSALEQRRSRELHAQVATLAENPTLKAALDTYQAELGDASDAIKRELVLTIDRELEKLAARILPDVVAVADRTGRIVAAAGRRTREWPVGSAVQALHDESGGAYVTLPSGVFQFADAPLALQDTLLGTLQLATALDDRYAQELAVLSGAGTLILSADRVVASTLSPATLRALSPDIVRDLPAGEPVTLAGVEYAVKLLFKDGDAAVYAVDSIDASTQEPLTDALRAIGIIALGSFAFAVLASVWLARTIARPVDKLSRSLSEMTRSRDFDNLLPPTGDSLEVDTLTSAFNTMMRSVSAAEAETRSAYVGTIRALALALDARDPYTAGHSERVSALSVAIGRQMQLSDQELDILRLGALLHDIGKIGISDAVLMKPGALTAEEFELIKEHPSTGARILRSVPFLAAHLPIVELHHERPDGHGYPHRLRGDEIPMLARIVHVADAFDAMTSARAYRPARGSAEALRELWRCAGSQFDAEVVQALATALPTIDLADGDTTRFTAALASPRLTVLSGGAHS